MSNVKAQKDAERSEGQPSALQGGAPHKAEGGSHLPGLSSNANAKSSIPTVSPCP